MVDGRAGGEYFFSECSYADDDLQINVGVLRCWQLSFLQITQHAAKSSQKSDALRIKLREKLTKIGRSIGQVGEPGPLH